MRVPVLLTLAVAACSPYGFSDEVGAVSAGVDRVSDGFNAGYASLDADRAEEVEIKLVTTRERTRLAPSCFVAVTKGFPESQNPCGLYPQGGQPPEPSIVEQNHEATKAALGKLRAYAHALAAVTNARDRASYDAAAAKLSAAVKTMAADASPGAGAAAPAVLDMVAWVVGTALDQQRFDSLKTAVNAVGAKGGKPSSPIHAVTRTLGAGLEQLSNERQRVIKQEVELLGSTLGPSMTEAAYRARLAQTEELVGVLDALRRCDPNGTTQALEVAHDALAAAVNDPERSFAGLAEAIGEFGEKAAALQAAFASDPSGPERRKAR